ncbi:nucleoside phosphatase family-domain-containing protein [Panaeolus papilionaceus]|nr:nucleoside phosphatase family-domain-containing protein [Panaeolus papilionaceus]
MIHSQPDIDPRLDSSTPVTPSASNNSTSSTSSTTNSTSNSSTTASGSTTLRSRSKSSPSSNDSQSTSSTTSAASSPRPAPLDFTHSGFSSFSLSQLQSSRSSQQNSQTSHSPPYSKTSHSHSHTRSSSASNFITMLLSPRSSNYERLEGGHGPSRLSKRKYFTWQRFVTAAVVIIGLVWIVGPRRGELKEKIGDGGIGTPKKIDPPPTHTTPSTDTEKPLTFDTDPNRSATPYCTTPHSSKSTLVQWSLMIDAGSTGSRIHIYKFNNCGASPSYEYEVFVKNQKGLSSFSGRPLEAAMSLDELLDEATKVVPRAMWACTGVWVKATAGLRLLGQKEADDILGAVEKRLRGEYPFSVPKEGAVTVMDGKDEGVYAWITANYLLGTIGHGAKSTSDKGKETYAVLDLGGASTQIVFKPEFRDTKSDKGLEEGNISAEAFACVGGVYGLDQAGGTEREVEYFDEDRRKDGKVVMYGGDVGSFEACQRVMALVLAKDVICETKPCSFNGVYQPSLLDTFKHGKVLLLSYFYDRIEPLLPPTSPTSPSSLDNLPISTLPSLASSLCAGRAGWDKEGWSKNPKLLEELEGRPEWCLDMTFMHALLRLGYEFGDERKVRVGKQVEGTELGWCLGAAIILDLVPLCIPILIITPNRFTSCVVMENLEWIKVTGEISLEEPKAGRTGRLVLVLGPTGAGKSSFLEALAGPSQQLSLSSNQLAGYTQHISAFTVVNAKLHGYPITLVDTPGFSDSKFSEKEILDMVKAWLNQERRYAVRILYLVPINGTRLPGTQRRTLEMLRTFLKSSGKRNLKDLMFVTTMWDTLYSEGALSRGQSNFEQLHDNQLKDFIDEGTKMVKFTNTQLSALQILDAGMVPGEDTLFTILRTRTPQLYQDLYERIENALLEKSNIEDDLAQLEAQININLRNILERNFCENNEILTKFIKQFNAYGDAPEGFEEAAQRLRQEIEIAMERPWPQILLREHSTALKLAMPGPLTIPGFEEAAQHLHPEINIATERPSAQILPRDDSTGPELAMPGPLTIPGPPATLREMRRRILEGAKRLWKKLFGSQR